MSTIKSYTDLEQSKQLAKILPIKSADTVYVPFWDDIEPTSVDVDCFLSIIDGTISDVDISAWSLVALLDVLPNRTDIVKDEADTENGKYMCTVGIKDDIIFTFGKNPIDACYEMILKLHELEIL